jgi:hypothetical protein
LKKVTLKTSKIVTFYGFLTHESALTNEQFDMILRILIIKAKFTYPVEGIRHSKQR